MIPPKYSELAQLFGAIDLRHEPSWVKQSENMMLLPVPVQLQIYLLWRAPGALTSHPVTRIYCNRVMASPLMSAFNNILQRNCKRHIHGYGGCFEIRNIRGRENISTHSWGLAIDLNPEQCPLGIEATDDAMHPDLVKCFTDAGFVWGGSFERPDPQHFQWVLPG